MASIGANPINSIGVEKQFPTGSNGYPLSGKIVFKSGKILFQLLQERTKRASYLANLPN